MRNHFVYDFETLSNCFVACFTHYKEDINKVFVIHELRDDSFAFVEFLEQCRDKHQWNIGFNNIAFDSQISEHILRNAGWLLTCTPKEIARNIYSKAQEVIEKSNQRMFQEYAPWKLSIKQVDIFKANHWDNMAKLSSLKYLQCCIDWHNVQEMPIHHTEEITTLKEIDEIIFYCQNDVASTKKIMQLSKEQLNLRAVLTKEYGIDLQSASEPRISRELFLHFLEQRTGTPKKEMKGLGTKRDMIKVSDILLPYVNFERQEFKMMLNNFKELVIDANNIKGSFKWKVKYNGVTIDIALGGLHGFRKPGIYEASKGKVIMTVDVQSFYPNLAIRNEWAPAHIPKKAFCDLYEWFFEERKKIPKKDPKNYVYKIILNATYGMSIEPTSPFFDPQYGMQTTINGQLLLCMLSEMLVEGLPESLILMQNTDGLEILIDEKQKDKYHQICKQFEILTKLVLEHDEYSKLFLWDVNNYIGLYAGDSTLRTKAKGRFEFEPHDKYEVASLHKNKSFLVVPKAIYNYFIHDIAPEDYLKTNRNIFDYCGYVRAKGAWQLTKYHTGKEGITKEFLQKTLRYYISNKGNKIVKINKNDGREISIEAGQPMCTVFNLYEEKKWEDYDIDEKYYLKQIYKEIETIKPNKKQMQLEL